MPKTLQVTTRIDGDPDIAEVRFEVTLKPGRECLSLDSLVIERALLNFVMRHVIKRAIHVRDRGVKYYE